MPAPEGGRASPEAGAAAAFVAALSLAFFGAGVLSIVGAPPKLTAAIPAVGALLASCGLGIALASGTSPDFLGSVAARAPRALALAFAGGALAWALGLADDAWLALAAGLGVLANSQFAGPLAAEGALSDGLAARFPHAPLRAAFALAFSAIGALTAMAGAMIAQTAAGASFGLSPIAIDVALTITLIVSAAPGGARGALWLDAMVGALFAVGALALAGWALARPSAAPVALAPLARDWAHMLQSSFASPLGLIALVAALAGFAPLAQALGGTRRDGAAKSGYWAFLFLAVALAALSLDREAVERASGGLKAVDDAFMLLAGLGLARAGTLVAARAFGSSGARSGAANLASLRLARLRLGTLGLAALFVALARHAGQTPAALTQAALELSLALIVPALALSRLGRAGALSIGAALCVGVAMFAAPGRLPTSLADLSLRLAGEAALAAFAAGLVVALLFPRDEDAMESENASA